MRQLIVKQLDYDLTPVAGLALVGQYLQAVQPVLGRLDAALPVKGGVANSDIVRSYLGLLVQGKSDFDAIENFRGDAFYKQALGIGLLPSSPTLRQRMDARASEMFDFAAPMIETLLSGQRPDYGVLPCGWLPLDVDTFAMDNGGTAKEGVGRTYAGVDGYCPLAAYLGSHGFCLELALRPGVQHSASETDFNLERVIPMAQRLSAAGAQAPILVRFDSGFDSVRIERGIEACNRCSVGSMLRCLSGTAGATVTSCAATSACSCRARATSTPSRTFAAMLSTSRHWASVCCRRARRCASAWTRVRARCSTSQRR